MVLPRITKLKVPKTLAFFILAAVVFRIPTLFEPYWYGDEAIYLTLGEAARKGLLWYRDIFDHKPPMIYLLAALAGSVFWFRAILLVWHAVTIVLFWELAEILFQKNKKAVTVSTGIFTLLTTIPLLEATIANSEIFMLGPTIAAFILVLGTRKPASPAGGLTYGKIFAAGLLFSLATLFKVPAAFDMVALVAFWGVLALWKLAAVWETIKRSIVLAAGFLLPILLTVDYYWMKGALGEYLQTAWFFNFGYISGWGVPFEVNLLFRTQLLALLLLVIVVLKKRFDSLTLFASLWFLFTVYAMLLSGRPYPHYAIQVVPPLALLLGILGFWKERNRFLTVPFLLLFLLTLNFYKFGYYSVLPYYQNFLSWVSGQKTQEEYFRSFDQKVPRTYRLAEIITARTHPNDKIFIWGTAPEVYALSRRLPPGRFITAFHIHDNQAYQETLRALEEQKPKYIIVLQNEKGGFPGFFEFLQRNYIFIENVNGAEIWRGVDPKIIK